MPFFRYPGGKTKLADLIADRLRECLTKDMVEYREPFFGGGGIGLRVMATCPRIKKLWINDKDPGVASLWTSVIRYPGGLRQRVMDFKPSVEAFDEFRQRLLALKSAPTDMTEIISAGFMKLAIHQISYSGLGTKSGGPLGGRGQKSKYKIDCRWSPEYIAKSIGELNEAFKRFEIEQDCCTNLDFERVVQPGSGALVYLDPPYYVKGNDLYQCGFEWEDHARLSRVLRETENRWVLSYDDCLEVREFYKWAVCEKVTVNYSITAVKGKKVVKEFGQDREEDANLATQKDELLIYTENTKKLMRFSIQQTMF